MKGEAERREKGGFGRVEEGKGEKGRERERIREIKKGSEKEERRY